MQTNRKKPYAGLLIMSTAPLSIAEWQASQLIVYSFENQTEAPYSESPKQIWINYELYAFHV